MKQNQLLRACSITTLCLALAPLACALQSSKPMTFKGSITGRSFKDIKVKVGAGQSIAVKLASRSRSVNFNVTGPKSQEAFFISAQTGTNLAPRMVPIEGEYVIRVYQLGAAESNGEKNEYTVTVNITGQEFRPISSRSDALVKGTPYHAQSIATAHVQFHPEIHSCTASVIRRNNQAATVVFQTGSVLRRVLFVNGLPKAHDSREELKFKNTNGMITLQFGSGPSETYQFDEILITGG